MDFTERIWKHLEGKHKLSKEDLEFLDCFCSDFSLANTAEVLGMPVKEVMYRRFKLAKTISSYCFMLRKHLKNLAYEELVKALKQTKSEYLKKCALELTLKTEGIIKEPPIVSISIDQRRQIISEVNELLEELSETKEKELLSDRTGEEDKAGEIGFPLRTLKN